MIHLISDDPVFHEPRPMGNRHTNKVTAAERRAQQAFYYALNRDRIRAERQAKYRQEKPQVDKIALHAAKIAKIVNDSGPRLVILVKGKPVLHRPDSAAAQKHYRQCASIVGTYTLGATWQQIADDLRALA